MEFPVTISNTWPLGGLGFLLGTAQLTMAGKISSNYYTLHAWRGVAYPSFTVFST